MFSAIEDRARETEARAQSLCKRAAYRLKFTGKRVEVAERDRRETIDEADRKLQDASRALKQAATRITIAEDYATAAEFRAQAAEVQAQKLRQELALIEDAIRRRLICANPEFMGGKNVA
jgi:hypothetical protein